MRQRVGAVFGAGGLLIFFVGILGAGPSAANASPSDSSALDAGSDAAPKEARFEEEPDGGAVAFRATRVLVESLSFQNGDIPRAQSSLEKLAKQELSTCASERGGVQGEGSVELKFLVQARGRAEGVEVGKVKNVPPAVVQCLAWTLLRRPIGSPSEDPVFVSAVLKLVEDREAPKSKKPKSK